MVRCRLALFSLQFINLRDTRRDARPLVDDHARSEHAEQNGLDDEQRNVNVVNAAGEAVGTRQIVHAGGEAVRHERKGVEARNVRVAYEKQEELVIAEADTIVDPRADDGKERER